MNLYAMVNNDAVNGGDYLGMLVKATYNIKAQTFEATSDKGKPLKCGKDECSCGNNQEDATDKDPGPLPRGMYKIYQRIKKGDKGYGEGGKLGNAWILDFQDTPPGNDIVDKTHRFSFRIHLWVLDDKEGMKGSHGCIVLNKRCHKAFDKMVAETTKGDEKASIVSPLTWDKNHKVTSTETFDEVPLLGTLKVE